MKNSTIKLLLTVPFLTIISFTLKASTNVSGGIFANTTWTTAGSPYIVTAATVVYPNDTLIIQAGVTVKFADGVGLEIRNGTLIAIGTSVDPITFTSNGSSSPDSWGNIYLNGATGNRINHCNFYYATYAVYASITDSISIKNSTFSFNEIGIIGDYSSINLFVDSCSFSNNSGGGIDVSNSIVLVDHSNFTNTGTGLTGLNNDFSGIIRNCIIDSNTTGAKITNASIEKCIINNNGTGVSSTYGSNSLTNCTIESNGTGIFGGSALVQNCIINNNQTGYYGTTIGTPSSIKNCTIDSNSTLGIYLTSGYGNGIGDSLASSEIKNNGMGIEINEDDNISAAIFLNDIENNVVGIQLDDNISSIYCNKICGNISYDFVNSNSQFYAIPNNYWCTSDSATIESHIKSAYDDVSLGIVKFTPVDISSCYLTGCNLHISATVTNATCDTCHTGSATAIVENGTGNIIYTWYPTSPLQNTQTATGLASGSYSVCVTDGKGCTACSSSIFVDSSNCTGFSVSAYSSHATCVSCNDGIAGLNISGGSSPYTYTWIPNVSTHRVDSNLAPGLYTICAKDLYGCIACDTVTVGVGECSAHFELYPTGTPHVYDAVNMASGTGTITYDWNWGDGSADDHTAYPSHTYAAAGTYSITLSITDGNGCSNSYSNSFYLQRSSDLMISVVVIPVVTGINSTPDQKPFYIAPNPADDQLTLFLPDNITSGTLKIFNLIGALQYDAAVDKQETNIDVSAFAKGIYIIEASYGGYVQRLKFVKE